MDFDKLLADRTSAMDVNLIREILKVVAQPGMVSLAGGIPAPESFPMEIMRELTSIVIDKYGSKAFQNILDWIPMTDRFAVLWPEWHWHRN